MSAEVYFTMDSSFFLSFFFLLSLLPSNLRARWTGIQRKLGTCSEVNAIWKRVSKIWDIPSPYKLGPKTTFWSTSQLNGNFSGQYLRKETRYRRSVKCVDNHKGSPTSSQNNMNFGPQTALNWTATLPTLRKFCILFHCHAPQTEISKRNSTITLCQNGGRWTALTIYRRKVGAVPP